MTTPPDAERVPSLPRVAEHVRLERRPMLGAGLLVDPPREARLLEIVASEPPSSSTVVFAGPHGSGKTYAARWIACRLKRPLWALDVAAASRQQISTLADAVCTATSAGMVVLLENVNGRTPDAHEPDNAALRLLHEIALRHRRTGPPKAPLLIEADSWSHVRGAADHLVRMTLPDADTLERAARLLLGEQGIRDDLFAVVAEFHVGGSIRDLEEDVARARHFAAVSSTKPVEALLDISRARFAMLPREHRRRSAAALLGRTQLSQRAVQSLTGVSRETLRAHRPAGVAPRPDSHRSERR